MVEKLAYNQGGEMRVYIFLQCSKTKSFSIPLNLKWTESSTIEDWNKNWENSENKYLVRDLYNGRSIKKEFDLIGLSKHAKKDKLYMKHIARRF